MAGMVLVVLMAAVTVWLEGGRCLRRRITRMCHGARVLMLMLMLMLVHIFGTQCLLLV